MAAQVEVDACESEVSVVSIAYPVFDDIMCYADCANARQKVRLVGETLGGVIVVPKGRRDLIPPEVKARVLEVPCQRRGIFASVRLVSLLRNKICCWCEEVSNEKSLLRVIVLSLFSRVPVVAFCWDPPGMTVRDKSGPISRIRVWGLDLLFCLAVKLSRGCIMNLHPGFLHGWLGNNCRGKVYSYPNGTTLRKNRSYAEYSKKIPKRFVVACRVNKHKGCCEIIKFFTELYERDNGVSLIWIGGGETEKVRQTILDAGVLAGSLIMTGALPRDEALKYVATASFGLNIYSDVPSLRWNYVLKAPEFLSFGLPIVTNNLPGICEYAVDGETGVVFDDGDISMGVRKTLELLGDDSRYRYMSRKCLERASRYDWGKVNSDIASRIRDMIGK